MWHEDFTRRIVRRSHEAGGVVSKFRRPVYACTWYAGGLLVFVYCFYACVGQSSPGGRPLRGLFVDGSQRVLYGLNKHVPVAAVPKDIPSQAVRWSY